MHAYIKYIYFFPLKQPHLTQFYYRSSIVKYQNENKEKTLTTLDAFIEKTHSKKLLFVVDFFSSCSLKFAQDF